MSRLEPAYGCDLFAWLERVNATRQMLLRVRKTLREEYNSVAAAGGVRSMTNTLQKMFRL